MEYTKDNVKVLKAVRKNAGQDQIEYVVENLFEALDEIERLQSTTQSPKQPYQIKYKFMPNDRDIDDMKALTVWGTLPLAACQTLVDANDWRGQSMEFQVNGYHFTSDDLE